MNIHHRNLQNLSNKIFKVKNGLSSELMNDILSLLKNHTLYEQLRISGRVRSIEQNEAWKHLFTLIPNYGTLFQMNIKLMNYLIIILSQYIVLYIYIYTHIKKSIFVSGK